MVKVRSENSYSIDGIYYFDEPSFKYMLSKYRELPIPNPTDVIQKGNKIWFSKKEEFEGYYKRKLEFTGNNPLKKTKEEEREEFDHYARLEFRMIYGINQVIENTDYWIDDKTYYDKKMTDRVMPIIDTRTSEKPYLTEEEYDMSEQLGFRVSRYMKKLYNNEEEKKDDIYSMFKSEIKKHDTIYTDLGNTDLSTIEGYKEFKKETQNVYKGKTNRDLYLGCPNCKYIWLYEGYPPDPKLSNIVCEKCDYMNMGMNFIKYKKKKGKFVERRGC